MDGCDGKTTAHSHSTLVVARRCLGCNRGIYRPLAKYNYCLECDSRNRVRSRWLQLHLSTCIALLFASALLLWANFTPQVREWRGLNNYSRLINGKPAKENLTQRVYGWPCPVHSRMESSLTGTVEVFDHWQAAGNVWLCFALLAGVAITSEWRIRRRYLSHAREAACRELQAALGA